MTKRRSDIPLPTAAELRILQALWHLEEATVEQIVTSSPPKERPNYKTVQAFLRIMEQKGFVTHRVEGKVFVFAPLVGREQINRRSVERLLKDHFAGSASGLLINLLNSDSVAEGELDRLEELIKQRKGRKP